jgi:uncharacterized protein YjbI with pentapeptide repeats
LSGADLREANLSWADLRRSRLSQTRLAGARYNSATMWPDDFDPRSSGARQESKLASFFDFFD